MGKVAWAFMRQDTVPGKTSYVVMTVLAAWPLLDPQHFAAMATVMFWVQFGSDAIHKLMVIRRLQVQQGISEAPFSTVSTKQQIRALGDFNH
eukprot:5855182-Amphidinium_carterae.1